MEDRIYSVTEFNRMLKQTIEENNLFNEIFLKGEMSSVSYYKSGHLYFNLKDKESQIKCAAFNYRFKKIPEDLKEGDLVKVFCDIGVYEARGEVQILVRHIEKANVMGELFLKLEKLKKEMELQGYFSLEHKKPLPKYPKNIGVVTSFTGAALQDIIKTIKKRDNRINIYVYPAKVQGAGAKEEIVKGIEELNKIPEIDMIIAGRGGGSIEDLWCFNEKEVALAFFNSKKPIISAVGHEVDILLSDFVADARASTPTQAVELSVPEKKQFDRVLLDKQKIVMKNITAKLTNSQKELNRFKENYYIKNYLRELQKHSQELVMLEENLNREMKSFLIEKTTDLKIRMEQIIGLNPIKILNNGYSITTCNGKTLKNLKTLSIGQKITTKLADGEIKSIVKELVQ